MNKVMLISKKIDKKDYASLSIIANTNCFEIYTSDEHIYFVEDHNKIFGMKLKISEEEIEYASEKMNVLINTQKRVAIISYLKENDFLFNKKILDLMNNLNVENLSIFNYSFCVNNINLLKKIKKLDLIGNNHAIYGQTTCNIPNNLSINVEYLRISSPPNDIKKIMHFPNKILTLSVNFIGNYFPNSLTRLICNNEKPTNIFVLLFPNKIKQLELSNNFINDSLILSKIPLNIEYILIKINGNFINNQKKGIFNNFILKKNTFDKLHVFNYD
jgi:hypothetical protein